MDERQATKGRNTVAALPRHWKLTADQYQRMAEAGIPEVWIVNRAAARVEVYREPEGDGYRSVTLVERGGAVTPLAFLDLAIRVEEILG